MIIVKLTILAILITVVYVWIFRAMRRMKPKAVVEIRGRKYGLCPKCKHCLIEGDSYCDECFQRIDWSEN